MEKGAKIDITGKIHWLGHAAFFIEGRAARVYFDPYQLGRDSPKADIILVSHSHYDHCSQKDIQKILSPLTKIFGSEEVAKILPFDVRIIKPQSQVNVDGVGIEAVYAYNINKEFHSKSQDNLGYVVNIDGIKLYHAGDTDLIPEMQNVRADVALLPIGGTYTMGPEEAAGAVKIIHPKMAVPMHWGSIVGSEKDRDEFKRLCPDEAVILPRE